jgi:DNA polymerase III epsilon subunit-like protein
MIVSLSLSRARIKVSSALQRFFSTRATDRIIQSKARGKLVQYNKSISVLAAAEIAEQKVELAVVDLEPAKSRYATNDRYGLEASQLAAVKWAAGTSTLVFKSNIKTCGNVDPHIAERVGITNDLTATLPSFADMHKTFYHAVSYADYLAFYSAANDVRALSNMYCLAGNPQPGLSLPILDIFHIARLVDNVKTHKLADVAKYYGIDLSGTFHTADYDALVTSEMLSPLCEDVATRNQSTLNEHSDIKKEMDDLSDNEFLDLIEASSATRVNIHNAYGALNRFGMWKTLIPHCQKSAEVEPGILIRTESSFRA